MGARSAGAVVRMSPRLASNYAPIPDAGCWIWMGAWRPSKPGVLQYGIVSIGKKNKYAHRAFYEEYVGPIPEGMFVCHKCDTPQCVNPAHLFLGDGFQNMWDMDRKGRGKFRGSLHPGAALNEDQVVEIFKDPRDKRLIADTYGVSASTVRAIKHGYGWKHLNLWGLSNG